jgi:hypothetical protein
MQYITEDINNGDNRYFYAPVTETMAAVLQDPADVVMFDFIKRFVDRVSCGFVHVEVSCMVIDALLTKRYRHKNDSVLIAALATVTVLLRDHGMAEATSVMDVIRCIERKAATEIHEYEFYKVFRSLAGPKNEDEAAQGTAEPVEGEEPRVDDDNVAEIFDDITQVRADMEARAVRGAEEAKVKVELKEAYETYVASGYQPPTEEELEAAEQRHQTLDALQAPDEERASSKVAPQLRQQSDKRPSMQPPSANNDYGSGSPSLAATSKKTT